MKKAPTKRRTSEMRAEYDFSTNDKISAWGQIEEVAINGQKLTIVNGSELDLIAEYIGHAFKFPKELGHQEADNLVLNIDGRWNKFAASKIAAKNMTWLSIRI